VNSAVEVHDSTLAGVNSRGRDVVVRLAPAYVHRLEGRPGIDPGSGWLQDIDVVFLDAVIDSLPSQLPSRLSDGDLSIGEQRWENGIPLPLAASGDVLFSAVTENGENLVIRATGAEAFPCGKMRYVEPFPVDGQGAAVMNISRAIPTDHELLVEIWLRSVRATHTFLSEEDIQSFLPIVRDVALAELEIWVLCISSGPPVGFMGLTDNMVQALFLAPEFCRRGGGKQLIQHAQKLKGELTVDVNEQNPDACRFYEACGFVVEGRSELDSNGRPFPLLHMRQRRSGHE
jgi:putative acetyltransferase